MKSFSKILFCAGVFMLLFSFFININSFGKLVAQDGTIDNILIINYFWILRAGVFLFGSLLIFNKLYLDKINCRFSKNKKEIYLLFFMLIICLFIIEGISYYIVKHNYTQLAFKNKNLSYNNIEYNISASFNSLGFRDEEFDRSVKNRIAIVGDSYVFGEGVEKNQTFEDLLENKLKQKNEVVYNLGVSGTDLNDYFNRIREFIPILKPNITILSFYIQNDITCKTEGMFKKIFFPNTIKILKEYFLSKSYEALKYSIINNSSLKEKYKDNLKKGLINFALITQSITHPDITENHRLLQQWFENCSINKDLILNIKNYAEKYNSRFTLLIIPPNYQVSSENWKSIEDLGYVINDSLLKDRRLQDSILQFCSQQRLECIDLLPYLKNSEKSPYFNLESHFNIIGHEITSEVLFNSINNKSIS